MSDDLRPRVEHWLGALGCTPEERPDPASHWHLTFEYPVGTGNHMLVVEPLGPTPSVVVASLVRLTDDHLKAFRDLPKAAQRSFLVGLRRALNRTAADFRLGAMDGPESCPRSFQVSARRYPDALGLDAFAHTVGSVFKAQLEGIWFIQEHLESHPDEVTVFFDVSGPDMPQA
jgi:hypothetical protein